MIAEPDVSRLARTIGDATRMRMLTLLMEGRALTAKELAYGSGVGPATGTAHLRRLFVDELVSVRVQGRHKYFRLSSPQVARCVESLLVLAQPVRIVPTRVPHPLREARFCYDHLAGRFAIQLSEALLQRRFVLRRATEFVPTAKGESWLKQNGINLDALHSSRRKLGPACMDWSERKDHIGGALGAALAQILQEKKWIKRLPDSRAVVVTTLGRSALSAQLGLPGGVTS